VFEAHLSILHILEAQFLLKVLVCIFFTSFMRAPNPFIFAPRNLNSFAHSEIWTYGCCPLWFISSLFTRVLFGFFLSKSAWLYSPITNA